jgi:hypothetical protein
MAIVEDTHSAWCGIIPVPRMIQNQLGHLLELHMIRLDEEILKHVHKLLHERKRTSWVVTTLAVFCLLLIRELDAGRIIFWKRYRDPVRVTVSSWS